MLLVLDTNEYVFAFGTSKKSSCKTLIAKLATSPSKYKLRISRLIVEEVKRNLVPELFREFIEFIPALTNIDEDIVVPFEIAFKYETKGFKPADAFIAAYTEWVGADVLVTENQHFLTRHLGLPFKVLTAEKCLKLI